uniref:Uncharacterized protein n=1 Tax=Schizaphis graminum TaxID=13262 RepID=A0A2S2NUS5_SCHGA
MLMTYIYYWSLERHYKRFALYNTDIMYLVSSSYIILVFPEQLSSSLLVLLYTTHEHIIYFILICLSPATRGFTKWKYTYNLNCTRSVITLLYNMKVHAVGEV